MATNNSKEDLEKLLEQKEEELAEKEKEIQRLQKTRLGLYWDKEREPEQVVLDCEEKLPVLKRVKQKEIKNKAGEENILIEGDNFHALTCLNYTHKEKIDVIYIDPPYNTGAEDWKYNNNYVNKEDGFRHSKWLNMMEKRLRLAKLLLKEKTGILICAIDENERATLELLLQQLFKNYRITSVSVVHNPQGIQGNNFSYTHEYILFIFKDYKDNINKVEVEERIEGLRDDTGNNYLRTNAKNCFYPIFVKDNKIIGFGDVPKNEFHPKDRIVHRKDYLEVWPIRDDIERKWRFARQSIHKIKKDLKIKETKRGIDVFQIKKTGRPKTVWIDPKYHAGGKYGTKLVDQMVGKNMFDYPKSLYSVIDSLKITLPKNGLVLDFFAGSGTTGHAVLELNKEDGGSRKFILCTNNENKICENVTYPRIEKAMNGYAFQGKDKTTLYTKEIKNYTALKQVCINKIIDEVEEVKETNKEKYRTSISFQDDILKVEGEKNITDKKEGLGGNLHYFKTDLIPAEHNKEEKKKKSLSDKKREELTSKAGQMIALKEDLFEEVALTAWYQIFETKNKKRQVGIYFREDKRRFNELLKLLKSKKIKTTLYTFSYDKIDKKEYAKIDNKIHLEDIPEPILEIYKQVNASLRK